MWYSNTREQLANKNSTNLEYESNLEHTEFSQP